jgi:hypothetical protein
VASQYTLVIGDKNLSSWSLRARFAMKTVQIGFEEGSVAFIDRVREQKSSRIPARAEYLI